MHPELTSPEERISEPALPFSESATHVRYQVLAVACSLALLTYIQRQAFMAGTPQIKEELGLSSGEIGNISSAFLIAYALFQVPGGFLADRLGARHLLAILVLAWSLLTGAVALASSFAVGTLWPFVFLLLIRFFFGMFQAGGFPTVARVVADWMPIPTRASAQGAIWMVSRLGGAIVPLLFLWLSQYYQTWRTPFWIFAALGLAWTAVFWPWFRNRPEEMSRVNAAERALITSGRTLSSTAPIAAPWRLMLSSLSVWSLCLMYGFVGVSGNFITSLLAVYLKDHRGFTEAATQGFCSLALACGLVSCCLGGVLSDWCIGWWGSKKWGRRLIGSIGLVCAGVCFLATIWVENAWLVGILFSAVFFFNDLSMGPAWAACADVGERHAGTISGAMNMTGSLFAAASMSFAGHMFDLHKDNLVFIVFACSYGVAALCWLGVNAAKPLLVSDSEVQGALN